jgi:hypothetical protein
LLVVAAAALVLFAGWSFREQILETGALGRLIARLFYGRE